MTIPLVTITLVRTTSFSIYTWTKDELLRKRWLTGDTASSTAGAGFLGGAAAGLLLSVGTSAFEYTKIKLQLEYLIACVSFAILILTGGGALTRHATGRKKAYRMCPEARYAASSTCTARAESGGCILDSDCTPCEILS